MGRKNLKTGLRIKRSGEFEWRINSSRRVWARADMRDAEYSETRPRSVWPRSIPNGARNLGVGKCRWMHACESIASVAGGGAVRRGSSRPAVCDAASARLDSAWRWLIDASPWRRFRRQSSSYLHPQPLPLPPLIVVCYHHRPPLVTYAFLRRRGPRHRHRHIRDHPLIVNGRGSQPRPGSLG